MKRIILILYTALVVFASGCGSEKANVPSETPQSVGEAPSGTPTEAPTAATPEAVPASSKAEPLGDTEYLLGTVCSIRLYNAQSQDTLDKAFARIAQIEKLVSANEAGTEVDAINKAAGVNPVKVSADTINIIKKGIEYSEKTQGSFDISIGPIVKLWNIGFDNARVPEQWELDQNLPLVGYKDIVVDDANQTVFLKRKGMMLDLGAVAKGYSADAVAEVLLENGVTSAIIDLGGNIFALGDKQGGTWLIGIRDPLDEKSEIVGAVKLKNKSVVTSGIYERFYVAPNGKHYHHILSPSDGYPYNNEIEGVSIISDLSVDGDGLSTSVFSKDLQGGIEFIESIDGVEAIFVMRDKSVYLTDGLKGNFELRNSSYTVKN